MRKHWQWTHTDRATGSTRPVDEAAVRTAMVEHTHDIDRAIALGYQGENLETPRSFYHYAGIPEGQSTFDALAENVGAE